MVTDQPIPTDSYVISGENSRYKSTFFADDYIYINRGGAQGVKVGDEFDVVRAVSDRMASTAWFKYQTMLSRAMGTQYADIGRLRIVHVDGAVLVPPLAAREERLHSGTPRGIAPRLSHARPPPGRRIA